MASHGHSIRVRDAAAAVLSDTTVFNYITQLPHTPRRQHLQFSTAIQTADAQTILNAASARMLRVSIGVM